VKKLNRNIIFSDKWLTHYVDRVQMPSGKILNDYHVLEFFNDSVAVVLTDEENKILLIQSVRYPSQSVEWEIPAGGIEINELPEDAARRELSEETGFIAGKFDKLCEINPMNDITTKLIHIFTGTVLGSRNVYQEEEVVGFQWFSISELKAMVRDNTIRDAITLCGLFGFLARGE
jgi:8-oxo-dGTP pyrophosphatase MutT (NUDIX family)